MLHALNVFVFYVSYPNVNPDLLNLMETTKIQNMSTQMSPELNVLHSHVADEASMKQCGPGIRQMTTFYECIVINYSLMV